MQQHQRPFARRELRILGVEDLYTPGMTSAEAYAVADRDPRVIEERARRDLRNLGVEDLYTPGMTSAEAYAVAARDPRVIEERARLHITVAR